MVEPPRTASLLHHSQGSRNRDTGRLAIDDAWRCDTRPNHTPPRHDTTQTDSTVPCVPDSTPLTPKSLQLIPAEPCLFFQRERLQFHAPISNDPMVTEAELPAQLGRVVGIVPDVGVMPDVVSPTLEMVTFSGARLEPLCEAGPKSPPPAVAMLTDDGFVNTTRGSSLGSLEPEIITASPASFVRKVSKPPVAPVATAAPLRRRARRLAMLAIAPQRSARLAKKALGRTPAVAATQNLLMKKLGLAKGPQHEMTDFDRYIQLFADGLSVPQVQLIRELFSDTMPSVEDKVLEIEVA
jgi:hypothetical protein